MKAFFEDPALLVGLPFIILGAFGLVVAAGALLAPKPALSAAGGATDAHGAHRGHPDEAEYIKVGLTLAAITLIEVAIYYINVPRNLFVAILIALSAAKFAIVVMWFMHLRFDSRIFTTAFVGGMVLAFGVFTVLIVTLGSNIV